MKSVLTFALGLIAISSSAFASPKFSAFNDGDNLYVTILGDGCNSYGGNLLVDPTCQEGRPYKNLARECYAELSVLSTKMACPGSKPQAKVLVLSLAKEKVAKEAEILQLNYNGEQIDVDLTK